MKNNAHNSCCKKFKPKLDKLFWYIWIPMSALMITLTVFSAFELSSLLIAVAIDAFVFYFMFSSLSGFAELRENSLYVKFGFILKREIPYDKIRGIEKERKFYSYSMLSLKNALEHVTVKYNKFDSVCISVTDNDEFINELKLRIEEKFNNS